MSKSDSIYVDLDGRRWDVSRLDAAERRLLGEIQKKAVSFERSSKDPLQRWCDFDNYWPSKILAFYKARKLSRRQALDTPLFEIAHDLSGRLSLSLGLTRRADYRDRLREIIATKFKTRRDFCKKSGIAEDMLSHVLAGRKHLSMDALASALDRIGYSIDFVPQDSRAKSA